MFASVFAYPTDLESRPPRSIMNRRKCRFIPTNADRPRLFLPSSFPSIPLYHPPSTISLSCCEHLAPEFSRSYYKRGNAADAAVSHTTTHTHRHYAARRARTEISLAALSRRATQKQPLGTSAPVIFEKARTRERKENQRARADGRYTDLFGTELQQNRM